MYLSLTHPPGLIPDSRVGAIISCSDGTVNSFFAISERSLHCSGAFRSTQNDAKSLPSHKGQMGGVAGMQEKFGG